MSDQPEWDEMFDVQYDLLDEVKKLIDERLRGLPALVTTMAHLYIIEGLAERARFNTELPKLPWREPTEENA